MCEIKAFINLVLVRLLFLKRTYSCRYLTSCWSCGNHPALAFWLGLPRGTVKPQRKWTGNSTYARVRTRCRCFHLEPVEALQRFRVMACNPALAIATLFASVRVPERGCNGICVSYSPLGLKPRPSGYVALIGDWLLSVVKPIGPIQLSQRRDPLNLPP